MEDNPICGIVGVAGNLTAKHVEAFKTLLIVDTIRGPHSTGVAGISNTGDWDLIKKKGNAWDLFDCKDYTKVVSAAKYGLIGHNRYATKGKINNINAHPFEFENVVGCHNGTIRGQHRLIDHLDFEVDSENIFHSIEQVGLEDTLSVLDGAYALVYWDKRTEELIMVRNSERPLYYTYSKDNKTVYWASEQWMLYVAISRAGLEHNDVIEVKPCTIYRFDIDMRFNGKPIKTSIQKFKEFKPPVVATNTYYRGYTPPAAKKDQPADGGNKSLPVVAATSETLRKLIGTTVEFSVEGQKQGTDLKWYVKGELKSHPGVEVKVYTKPNSKEWNNLIVNYDAVFEGTVVTFAQYGEIAYVTVKAESVVQVIDDELDGDKDDWGIYLGFNNSYLEREEWLTLTKLGCAWCQEIPGEEDACNIEWIEKDKHICAGCQETERWEKYRKEA